MTSKRHCTYALYVIGLLVTPTKDEMTEDEFLKSKLEVDTSEGSQLPQELLNEIDLVLGEAVREKDLVRNIDLSHLEEPQDYGIQEMQNTFLDLISHNLSPLTRYVKAFSLGANYDTILELCDLLVTPILPRLKHVELHQHFDELTFFKSVLHFAKSETDPKGREVMKSVVFRSFKELQKRFHLSYRGSKIAVKNLIVFLEALQVNKEITESVIQRFFAIGVPSLTWVRKTKSEELTSLSGIPVEIIHKIRLLAKEQKAKKTNSSSSSGNYRVPGFDRKQEYSLDSEISEPYVVALADDQPTKKL